MEQSRNVLTDGVEATKAKVKRAYNLGAGDMKARMEAKYAKLVEAAQEHRHTDLQGHEVAWARCAICAALRELEVTP